jgi:hypothetical protein
MYIFSRLASCVNQKNLFNANHKYSLANFITLSIVIEIDERNDSFHLEMSVLTTKREEIFSAKDSINISGPLDATVPNVSFLC